MVGPKRRGSGRGLTRTMSSTSPNTEPRGSRSNITEEKGAGPTGKTPDTRRAEHSEASMTPEEKRTLKGLVVAVLAMQILTPFLQSAVAVLLPSMGRELGATASELGLVSTVYCMALAIFNLAMGRAGDKWGRRRVCLMSMVILTPTVGLVFFAPNIETVIALRFAQGMGTAAFTTSSLAMLVACSPPNIRGRLLGITTTGVYIGVAIGPVLGGYINQFFGWRWFFLGIAVWAVFGFMVMALLVKKEWYESPEKSYDWGGFLLYAASMMVLVQGCVGPMDESWRLPVILAGLAVAALFIVWEYRLKSTMPLLDVRVLVHNAMFVLSNLASFSLYASLFSITFFFSLYLQYARGMDSGAAGLVVFLQPVVQVGFTWFGGWLTDRTGAAPVALAGNLLVTASLVLALFVTGGTSMYVVFLVLVLNGIGMALFVTPNTVMIMSSVDPAHMSQASGLVGTCRTAGMMTSMVIATTCLRLATNNGTLSAETSSELVSAMHMSFMVFASLSLLSFLCSVIRVRSFRKV